MAFRLVSLKYFTLNWQSAIMPLVPVVDKIFIDEPLYKLIPANEGLFVTLKFAVLIVPEVVMFVLYIQPHFKPY